MLFRSVGRQRRRGRPALYCHRRTERVEIDHLQGRVTVGLVTPYPPGIPLLIPGEVFNQKIVDYLKFARTFALECPGFETDIHGLVEVEDEQGRKRYFADCVLEEKPAKRAKNAKEAVKKRQQPAKG